MAAIHNAMSPVPALGGNSQHHHQHQHRSLQEIIQHRRQHNRTLDCSCHLTVYKPGDFPRSQLSMESEEFLRSIDTFPLVIEKRVDTVGEFRIELWNTSAAALTSCSMKLLWRLELEPVTEEGGAVPPDPFDVIAAASIDADEAKAVEAQRRKGSKKINTVEEVRGLLEEIMIHPGRPNRQFWQ